MSKDPNKWIFQNKLLKDVENFRLKLKYKGDKTKIETSKILSEAVRTGSLDISFNLNTLPKKKFQKLTSLTKLTMSAAGASELISEIKYLPNLVYLNLTGNYLVNLPFEITSCSALRTLLLASNKFTKVPSYLTKLTLLEELSFEKCELENISGINANVQLRKLNLCGNKISQLPEEFMQLTSLEHLDISDNLLEKLPEDFGKLIKIKELHVERNRLEYLPNSMNCMVKLRVLQIKPNPIKVFPRIWENMIELDLLDLSSLKIEELPAEVVPQLRGFREIILSNNLITALPTELSTLGEVVERIDLKNNPIIKWPITVRQMKNIEFNWSSININNVTE
ncbi:leucine-rich repeat protein lrrA-like [Zophobas morio]|uniref:leucine-rich repeat protein lrrA-like n=1 Tax=Zophobas morio TaxID=2755281 RepID=UPI003082E780